MNVADIARLAELMGSGVGEDDERSEREECCALCDKAYEAAGVHADDVEAFSFHYRRGELVMALRMKPETQPVVVEIEVPTL